MNDKKLPRAFILVICTVFSVALVSVFTDSFIYLSARVALASARSFLPESGISLPKTEEASAASTEESSEAKTTEKEIEKISQQPEVQKITTSARQASTEAAFTDTPEDILKLIKEEKAGSEKDKKDGAISGYKYTNDGVTDSYKNVRVKNVNKASIDIESLLEKKLDLTVKKDEPSVLIFHTHTTETYQILDRDFYETGFLSRSNDNGRNMVRVGEAIVEEIEKAGYTAIHDKEIHDSTYNGAYGKSRASVEEYLKKYPSIKIVLDIHRDAIQRSDGTKIQPVADIKGKKAAQIMIISGCQEEGNGVENFPNWAENLVFAVHLQKTLEDLFEGITRPLYFSPRKYNMDLTPCSLLVEVGSDGNTLEQAVYTGKCLGVAVSEILSKYEE